MVIPIVEKRFVLILPVLVVHVVGYTKLMAYLSYPDSDLYSGIRMFLIVILELEMII